MLSKFYQIYDDRLLRVCDSELQIIFFFEWLGPHIMRIKNSRTIECVTNTIWIEVG